MSGHSVSLRFYFGIFGTLILLTGLTIGAAYVDLGAFNTLVALVIAVTKATLVILFFMHIRWSSRLTQVVAASGFFWLLIAFTLMLSDYLTRYWDYHPTGWIN